MRFLRGDRFDEEVPADDRGRIPLDCWRDYVIEADEALALPQVCVKRELHFDESGPWRAMINFGDYIGVMKLGERLVEIRSRKIGPAGFDRLLHEVSTRIANLPFDINSPAFVPFTRDDVSEKDRLYHAFIYLRWAFDFADPRLVDAWAQIAADPHRTLVREVRHLRPWEARGIAPSTIEHIVSHPEEWEQLGPDSSLASTPLARRLGSRDGVPRFPGRVAQMVAETCIDTPENRFVRYFLDTAVELVGRFIVLVEQSQQPDSGMLDDAHRVLENLRVMQAAGFLREVGVMQRFPAQSQALQKRPGYREVLLHYQAMILAARYPIASEDLTRIIETKSASLLYEYWCFFEVAEEIRRRLGLPTRALPPGGDELHATLEEGIHLTFEGGVELHYNRSFSRRNSTWRSYSVPLRPDIVLRVGSALYLFDAKFRMERCELEAEQSQEDFDRLEADDRAEVASRAWWKNADIAKMHAYRDALGTAGATVSKVWVLYPGTEPVFYEADDGGGIGALPLDPTRESTQLREVLGHILCETQAEPVT